MWTIRASDERGVMRDERKRRSSFVVHHSPFARSRGFTLVEGLLAAAVLGVATVAVVGPIMAARQQSASIAGDAAALALARQLMEEIAAKPYADPDDGNIILGPEATEPSRAYFDNVDDYHGYTDSTQTLRTVDGQNAALAMEATVNATTVTTEPPTEELPSPSPTPAPQQRKLEFARRVSVEYRAGPQGPKVAAGDFAVVTVRVTHVKDPSDNVSANGNDEGVELSGLVTRVSLRK